MAAKAFPQKAEGVGLDSMPGQPGQGMCSRAGVLQPVQSCSVVANGGALKSFDVEEQC